MTKETSELVTEYAKTNVPRMITVCRCGSPRVYRDAAMNVNTEKMSMYDSMSCSDCGYDGRHYRQVEIADNFDLSSDSVEPGPAL